MSRYSIFQTMYLSFFSKDLYRDVVANWSTGKVFLYLLLLLTLSWIILAVPFQKELNKEYRAKSEKLLPQFPMMTISQGIMSTPEKRAYIIVDPDENNKPIIMIDTTGQHNTLDQSKTDMLITSNQVLMKSHDTNISIYKIPTNLNAVLVPEKIKNFLNKSASFAWVIFIPLFVLFSYLYRIFQALIDAVIGKIFARFNHVSLTFKQIFRIAIITMTPIVAISTILSLLRIFPPFIELLFFAITMIYLFFGVLANKQT